MSADIEISIKKDIMGVYYVEKNGKILGNVIEYAHMIRGNDIGFNTDNRIFSMTQWTYKRLPVNKRKTYYFASCSETEKNNIVFEKKNSILEMSLLE